MWLGYALSIGFHDIKERGAFRDTCQFGSTSVYPTLSLPSRASLTKLFFQGNTNLTIPIRLHCSFSNFPGHYLLMRFSPLRHTINHTNQSIPVTLADAALWNPSPSLIYIFSVIISDRRYTFDLLLGYPLHDLWFTYDGECLHRRFSENQLGTAGYHHASDFVDVSTTPSYSVALGSDLSETPPSTPPDKNGLNQQKLENCDPEGKAADFREVLTHASEDRCISERGMILLSMKNVERSLKEVTTGKWINYMRNYRQIGNLYPDISVELHVMASKVAMRT
ncbi:hypothetical protein HID58_090855 [Brassica napus]|uniref:Uncharacterized protein n=1 Tax=Brassica napus TaxID=3708 RepID=A0ABQ7X8V1_BRANA|nr:hypothetical protein HID58_090855 [Brassica napus]